MKPRKEREKGKTDRDDDVRAVAVPGDDLEAFDGLCVANNVVEGSWSVLCD